MSEEQAVLLNTASGVATLTLNRPDKLNSFTRHLHRQLAQAFDVVEQDPSIRAVVITGAGRAFSAGQDLADLSFEFFCRPSSISVWCPTRAAPGCYRLGWVWRVLSGWPCWAKNCLPKRPNNGG